MGDLRRAGRWKVFVRSDQEPATRALINAACATMYRVYGVEAVPDPVRRGDGDANGLGGHAAMLSPATVYSFSFLSVIKISNLTL